MIKGIQHVILCLGQNCNVSDSVGCTFERRRRENNIIVHTEEVSNMNVKIWKRKSFRGSPMLKKLDTQKIKPF